MGAARRQGPRRRGDQNSRPARRFRLVAPARLRPQSLKRCAEGRGAGAVFGREPRTPPEPSKKRPQRRPRKRQRTARAVVPQSVVPAARLRLAMGGHQVPRPGRSVQRRPAVPHLRQELVHRRAPLRRGPPTRHRRRPRRRAADPTTTRRWATTCPVPSTSTRTSTAFPAKSKNDSPKSPKPSSPGSSSTATGTTATPPNNNAPPSKDSTATTNQAHSSPWTPTRSKPKPGTSPPPAAEAALLQNPGHHFLAFLGCAGSHSI